MSTISSLTPPVSKPGQDAVGDGNDDLRAERRAILRESLKESNDAMYHNEKKKNIEALR